MSSSDERLPENPSAEQLRKQAKDLLRAARAGETRALERIRERGARRAVPARPEQAKLADAQATLAREHGFGSWAELLRAVAAARGQGRAAALQLPLIRPAELTGTRPYTLPDGTVVSTDDVFRMFVAARAGDRASVERLIRRARGLATVEYNYTPPIHFAVREGHAAIVELLLEHGADPAYRTYPFGDALLTMAEEREHDEVAALLRSRLARRFSVTSGMRQIIEAAARGDVEAVRREVERRPELIRGSDETGDTPLHRAASLRHRALVEMLLDAGADPDAVRGDGYRPIHLAIMPNWSIGASGSSGLEIADLLLARGARNSMFIAAMRGDSPYIREALRRDRTLADEADSCQHRPLSAAVRRNDTELVQLLLDHGADPNAPEEGASRGHALWVAAHDRRHDLVRLLLQHGADPNAYVESSGTPMEMARGDDELYALLVAHGGVADAPEGDRFSSAVEAERYDEVERMIRARPGLLEEAGWGDGILAGPAHDGNHRLIEMLMRLGARVPKVSKWAPYYYFKHESTAAFLLAHGMDPNHMNWHRLTLLHHMAAEGELGKARLLLDHGADIDALDEEYRSTPLGLAARRGQMEMVELLLSRGADPKLSGAPWSAPLGWARRRGHDAVARRLEEAVGA